MNTSELLNTTQHNHNQLYPIERNGESLSKERIRNSPVLAFKILYTYNTGKVKSEEQEERHSLVFCTPCLHDSV